MSRDLLYRDALRGFLEPIQRWLDDPDVTEIMVNGPSEIFVSRGAGLVRTQSKFSSDDALMAAARSISQFVGHPLDDKHLVLEGRLPDGSRVQAVIPPAAPEGTMLAIRKRRARGFTLDELVHNGTLPREAAETLHDFVLTRKSVLVAGGAGVGKTSLLTALALRIPSDERIVLIEDSPEVQLPGRHVVRLQAHPGSRGQGSIDTGELLGAAMRLCADRLVLGELRAGETFDFAQALTSGYAGSLTTTYGSYPLDALRRVETLASMRGLELPLGALRAQVASAFDVIVMLARRSDGQRVVSEVSLVQGLGTDGNYALSPVFQGDSSGRLVPAAHLREAPRAVPRPPHLPRS